MKKLLDNFPEVFLALTIVVMGFSVIYATNRAVGNQETLPYSRPHLDFERDNDGKRCVAWIVVEQGSYFVICNREPPMIVPIHEVHNMRRPGWSG